MNISNKQILIYVKMINFHRVYLAKKKKYQKHQMKIKFSRWNIFQNWINLYDRQI